MVVPQFVADTTGEALVFLIEALSKETLFGISSRSALLEVIDHHLVRQGKAVSKEERVALLRSYNAAKKLVWELPEGESQLLATMVHGWIMGLAQDAGLCPGCFWEQAINHKEGCQA